MRAFLFLLCLTACEDPNGGKVDDVDGDGLSGADDCDDTDATVGGPTAWMVDGDGDGYAGSTTTLACEPPDDAVSVGEDCDDAEAAVHPAAEERCDGVDNNCDGRVDEGVGTTFYADADGDGFGDAGTPVEACEQPAGTVPNADDCDDADAERFPDQEERCNGVDDDCDGDVDEDATERLPWYGDGDGDGYGDPGDVVEACAAPDGRVGDATDCDDSAAAVNPGATEVCDSVDNDCDGAVDEDDAAGAPTWYIDTDGDGYGVDTSSLVSCNEPSGFSASNDDCDDTSDRIHPGAPETDCTDPVDYNCDGSVAYADADGDGWPACEDCDDTDAGANPSGIEVCDGADNDCDGTVDEPDATDALTWYADRDGDTYGDAASSQLACDQPAGTVADASDCDDGDAAVNPAATETCNGVDDDCDGTVDEADAADATAWYADADGDAYGDPASSTVACDAPAGYVADATDCDDTRRLTHPGATEYCNSDDDDCNGVVDDSAVDARTWWADADGDSYGDPLVSTTACATPAGYVRDDDDCDDADGAINPAATEVCDGVDNDCDGTIDGVSENFDFDSGISSSWMVLNGTASASSSGGNGFLRLTGLTTDAAGSAWFVERQDATAFEVSFSFYIHGGSGADGLTFAWLSDTSTASLGATGGSIGVYGLHGYAVEFDTYTNRRDPNENHVALIDPATMTDYTYSTAIPELEDTGWHDATITMSAGTVEVWLDGTRYINYTISGYTMTEAMMGFTAGTGSLTNYHDVDDVEMACP
jgi:hypothetical protein